MDPDPGDCVCYARGHHLDPHPVLHPPAPVPPGAPPWAPDHEGAAHADLHLRSVPAGPHHAATDHALQLHVHRRHSRREVQVKKEGEINGTDCDSSCFLFFFVVAKNTIYNCGISSLTTQV